MSYLINYSVNLPTCSNIVAAKKMKKVEFIIPSTFPIWALLPFQVVGVLPQVKENICKHNMKKLACWDCIIKCNLFRSWERELVLLLVLCQQIERESTSLVWSIGKLGAFKTVMVQVVQDYISFLFGLFGLIFGLHFLKSILSKIFLC